ncbi:MAG TPA: bifunctional serine/threonine-protein kinase/formylglycine-generating enzyme family protein [Anaerolineae bacterium]|nr:bifunctional serine/threonine-protein kinase/formylglycine-generating enzyme family protein [Anaerolineae bacterium]
MSILPSTIIQDRYQILHRLGQGPYGAVYRAWDTVARRDCALKQYLPQTADAPQLFRQQTLKLHDLDHPQLPTYHDHFTDPDHGLILISQYIDGIDLQTLLDQNGPLPPHLIIQWLQALEAPLNYLHQKKQWHLNLKPANIRLTPDGRIYLVDTGLPNLGIHTSPAGWASPEQQNQQEITAHADQYSLGATLYALLTGHLPPEALRRQSGFDAPPARERNKNAPPYLSIVASRALSLRPDARYESISAFCQALSPPRDHTDLYQPATTTTSPPPATTTPPRFPLRPRRTIENRVIYALASILVLLVALTYLITQLQNEPDETTAELPAATATFQSEIIMMATALAPTPTLTPPPTSIIPTPQSFTDETGAQLLYMPGGVFRLGNDDGDDDEQPSVLVRLDPYFIDATEVTNGQYAQCVDDGACTPPINSGATYHRAYFGDPDFDNYPVIFVNWYDADTFCEWRGGRLPSEAEWERAASFDTFSLKKFAYPWGDAPNPTAMNSCDANCPSDNKQADVNDGHRDTAPVGSYANGRSPLGNYDMLGNVLEWVSDWYDPDYYQTAPQINPLGPVDGQFKSVRGGSWLTPPDNVGVTRRGSYDPTVHRANLGFRCAQTPS